MSEELQQHDDTSIAQKVQYEVEKEAARKAITFEYAEGGGEHFRVEVTDGLPGIVANLAGMVALAKLLLKLGSRHRAGAFELHLREDFDSDREQVLCLKLEEEANEPIFPGPEQLDTGGQDHATRSEAA